MQFYLISDNIDTLMGMRLVGVDGVIAHGRDEVKEALHNAIENKDIAIILITDKLVKLCDETIYDLKLKIKKPLIVEVPDRHATSDITTNISRYIRESVGLKI
ncbi:MAG: ATP synthase subunit F [Clostridiales bacterium]|nr:ATP synthase subunit F [Clostridiales bacterium]